MRAGGGAHRGRFRLPVTLLLTAAMLGLPAAVYAWGRASSSFSVDKVVVTGNQIVARSRIRRVLRHTYLGQNLFTITAADVKVALGPLCYVEDVTVDRDFPDTLRVKVAEHHPVAYVLSDGCWYVVADDAYVICLQKSRAISKDAAVGAAGIPPAASVRPDGAVAAQSGDGGASSPDAGAPPSLAKLEAGPPQADLRLPRLAARRALEVGATLDDPRARKALLVVAGLPTGLRNRALVAAVSDAGEVTLRFKGGLSVLWGGTERTPAKVLALRAVLRRYRGSDVSCTSMDVSMPDRVLARPVLK
jgi:hypothetical protein